MRAKKPSVGLGWVFVACLFLFNANITVFDLLPDFIGYILLCRAFFKLADLNESIGVAVSAFRRMILVDLGKYLAILWIFGMSVPGERNSSILLWTFVFSVLEMIFLIPAYVKLFGGIVELGYFYPNTTILKREGVEEKSRTEKMRNFTVIFVIVKAVLTVLPEFADLTNAGYDEMSGVVHLYRFIGLMRAMTMIPVIVVGWIWLVRMISYFRRLRRDRPLMEALAQKYATDIQPKVGLFAKRNVRYASALLLLAFCLTLDFRLEGQNYLPDFLASIFFLCAFIYLNKALAQRRWSGVLVAVAHFAVSLFSAIVEYLFYDRYSLSSLIKNVSAMKLYNCLLAGNFLKYFLFLLLTLLAVLQLRSVIRAHTGYVVGREVMDRNEQKMISVLHRELDVSFWIVMVCAVLYVFSDVCYDCLVPTFEWIYMIVLLVGVVCIAFLARALFALKDAIATKYMLE